MRFQGEDGVDFPSLVVSSSLQSPPTGFADVTRIGTPGGRRPTDARRRKPLFDEKWLEAGAGRAYLERHEPVG